MSVKTPWGPVKIPSIQPVYYFSPLHVSQWLFILLGITRGWCPFVNAPARDAVGSQCHLTKHECIRQSCEKIVSGFAVFSASTFGDFCRLCIQLKLSHATFIVSFLIIWQNSMTLTELIYGPTFNIIKAFSINSIVVLTYLGPKKFQSLHLKCTQLFLLLVQLPCSKIQQKRKYITMFSLQLNNFKYTFVSPVWKQFFHSIMWLPTSMMCYLLFVVLSLRLWTN